MAKLITELVCIVCWSGLAYGFVTECLLGKSRQNKRTTRHGSSRKII